jgi:hypothetical protein
MHSEIIKHRKCVSVEEVTKVEAGQGIEFKMQPNNMH